MKQWYVYHAGRLIDVVRAFTADAAVRIAEQRGILPAGALYARTTIV